MYGGNKILTDTKDRILPVIKLMFRKSEFRKRKLFQIAKKGILHIKKYFATVYYQY